ncbi:zinc-binding dehydrogenase [Streptomyces sp. NPDC040750]|uniref:zinc-binding dehydrogenase n=1 Tax=Streptomyces sp. NPDC040750 TaxID=3154491 RepID=UPI0033DB90E6
MLATGSGGVSLFTVQFAKLLGARVIATASRPDKEQRLRDLGADEVINYRDIPNWHTAARELTAGRVVDRIVDTAGTLEQSLKSVAVTES